MPRQITSFSNETVKRLRALRDKKARRLEGLFLAEGLRIIAEARDSGRLPEIIAFSAEHGYPPSVREIGAHVGLKSPSTVHFHLKGLESAGLITKAEGKTRSITVAQTEPPAPP